MPPVICFSNGVDNERVLGDALGPDKVIPGTVTSAISRGEDGGLVVERERGIGVAEGNARTGTVVHALRSAGFKVRAYDDALAMKWSKLLANLIANANSAIHDRTALEIFSDPETYRTEIAMLRECLAVMNARGIKVLNLPGMPVRVLAAVVRFPLWLSRPILKRVVAEGRGSKMPSLHIDLHSGRGKSEIEFLNGAVVRAGAEAGVATPVNQLLVEQFRVLACKQSKKGC